MGSWGGSTGRRRAHWAGLFALLLLALTAVPVLAASGEGSPSASPGPAETSEVDPALLPDESDIAAAIAAREAEEREREQELASPQAARQRSDSRLAFADFGPAESKELLRSLFSEQLAFLDGDPARVLSDAQIVRSYGGKGALVEEAGEKRLLEATFPLRVEDKDGELGKVDLDLRSTAGGFGNWFNGYGLITSP